MQLVVNTFLGKSFVEGVPVNSMKLQRLIYIAYSELFKQTREPPFGAIPECWSYGAVFSSVYHYYKPLHDETIIKYFKDVEGKAKVYAPGHMAEEVISSVWTAFRDYNTVELCDLLRVEGSAWDNAFQSGRHYLALEDVRNDNSYVIPMLYRT